MLPLLSWYKKNGRHSLPWRKENRTPYEIWVSEVMLQQTQVSRVISYYEVFLEKFPTVFDLAKASWEEFLPYYQGLGYYQRGRNMLRTAQTIVEDFSGEFPRDRKILESLPGIGSYTAAAILSFGYGEAHLAFDTNMQRVFGRLQYGDKKAGVDRLSLIAHPEIQKVLQEDSKTLNAAIMDFANLVCLNQNPKCLECPLRNQCEYYKTLGSKETKAKKEKQIFDTKNAQAFIWLHKNHKEYYSSTPDHYSPFILAAPYNTRQKIKEYFRENYNLELAVRPPHKKILIENKPTLFINAQILLGEQSFGVFRAEEMKEWEKI